MVEGVHLHLVEEVVTVSCVDLPTPMIVLLDVTLELDGLGGSDDWGAVDAGREVDGFDVDNDDDTDTVANDSDDVDVAAVDL